MASHKLSLEIPDTSNLSILRIDDTSVYTNLIGITCPQLFITVPGFNYSVVIPEARLTTGYRLILTACDLELQTTNCDSEFAELPDGIYAIKYAVSPHEYVYVEYNHLRITKAMSDLYKLWCDLDLYPSDPIRSQKEQMIQLQTIEGYLKAAKYKVENCHESKQGMDLYNYALKLIEKINCKLC
jgi:hypothetical protein